MKSALQCDTRACKEPSLPYSIYCKACRADKLTSEARAYRLFRVLWRQKRRGTKGQVARFGGVVRRCYICKTIRPLEEFVKRARETAGRSYQCKPCQAQERRAYHVRTKAVRADAIRAAKTFYKARQRGAAVEVVHKSRIHARDAGQCAICGTFVPLAHADLEHLVPLAIGGLHANANCGVAHKACNNSKHANFYGPIPQALLTPEAQARMATDPWSAWTSMPRGLTRAQMASLPLANAMLESGALAPDNAWLVLDVRERMAAEGA